MSSVGSIEPEGARARRDYDNGNGKRCDKSRTVDEENQWLTRSGEVASSKLMILQTKVEGSSASNRTGKWILLLDDCLRVPAKCRERINLGGNVGNWPVLS
jgi:hypothetical protein